LNICKGWFGSVFLHRYNNRTQMKPKPDPEKTEPDPVAPKP
jgi:hypothetical protein